MTYPPTPGGWQDPAGTAEPVVPQPTYIDPISGQPATVAPDPAQPYPSATSPAGYPAAYPTYGAVDPTYAAPGYAAQPGAATPPAYPAPAYGQPAYAPPAYPGYPTSYPGYGGYTTPVMPVSQKTNGMAIASMVVSLSGILFVFCYGAGALLGLLGAILGHVAQRQVRERGEGGGGMALAGVIIGWIVLAIGVIIGGFMIWAVVRFANDTRTY
jgi:Domain of unknown function (DUF4190)